MDLSKRGLLKVGGFLGLALSGLITDKQLKQKTGRGIKDWFFDIFDIKPEEKWKYEGTFLPGVSYREILPTNVVSELDSELRVFGWRSQLENIADATIAKTQDGEHIFVKIKPNKGGYDCFTGSRKVAEILSKNKESLEESIKGYRGFQVFEGIDYKGIYAQHRWVEIVFKDNKNKIVRVPIDYNLPYRYDQKEPHIGDETKVSPETNFIDISSGYTIIGERKVNDKNYITGVSMKMGDRPRILFTALMVPKEDNKKSEHHMIAIDPVNLKLIGEYAYRIEKITRELWVVGRPRAITKKINLTPYMEDLVEHSIIYSLKSLYNRLNNLRG